MKPIIELGYPPKIYHFTGEYYERTIGYYRAMRNKGTIYVPIYKSDDGEIINDMSQMIRKEARK